MDMTFGSEGGNSGSNVNEAYIGLDFGSSNSSISYVEKSAIKVYRDRSKDQNWLEFNDLLEVLPYPVAAPLAKYIASGNGKNQDSLALEAIEAFLGFAAFLSYCELCAIKGTEQTRFFKGFKQRSAGPLWALLRETQKNINSRSDFSKVYKRLLEEPFYSQIDKAVSELADFKHGKLSNDIDHFNILKILGNLTNQAMSGKIFGSFEDVSKLGFGKKGFSGQFRVAQGKNPPFIHRFSYEGIHSFSEEEIFVINLSTGIGICLSPLYFWAQNVVSKRTEFKQLYIYDINKMDEFSFKATDLSIPLKISSSTEYNALFDHLKIMKDSDQEIALYENINLQGSSQF